MAESDKLGNNFDRIFFSEIIPSWVKSDGYVAGFRIPNFIYNKYMAFERDSDKCYTDGGIVLKLLERRDSRGNILECGEKVILARSENSSAYILLDKTYLTLSKLEIGNFAKFEFVNFEKGQSYNCPTPRLGLFGR